MAKHAHCATYDISLFMLSTLCFVTDFASSRSRHVLQNVTPDPLNQCQGDVLRYTCPHHCARYDTVKHYDCLAQVIEKKAD